MSIPRFQLIPGTRLRASGDGGVGWRLLGANNRELGRSGESFPDAEAAHAAISLLPQVLPTAPHHVNHDAQSASWSWWIEGPEGTRIAVAGRGFRHEREARYNLGQFCEVAPSAPTSSHTIPEQPGWWRSEVDVREAASNGTSA